MSKYQPKIIEGKIKGTGWAIDGHTLMLSLWSYDNYSNYHLDNWGEEDDKAVMETVFEIETKAGLCLYNTLEEFEAHWEGWGSQDNLVIPLDNVEIMLVVQEEVRG